MTNKNKTVVFDWNGTLFDDVPQTLRATNVILKHLGHKPVTLEHYRKHHRVPISYMYKSFGVDLDELLRRTDEIHAMWNTVYNAHAKEAPLRLGAQQALSALKKQEHRVVILSNHTVESISGHTKRFGIFDHFESILAYERYGAAFTQQVKGERLGRYLDKHKISESIIVGDTEEEINIARARGLVSVAVTGGTVSEQRLSAAKPDFLIHDLSEIPGIADQIFGRKGRSA